MAGEERPAGRQGPGRPAKYKKKYCKMLLEHMDVEPFGYLEKKSFYQNGAVKSEEKIPWAASMPTFQSFARKIGVTHNTLLNWVEQEPEFAEAYQQAKEMQEHIWLVNGMNGLYNASFAQFYGKNCLGYKDRQELDVESRGVQLAAESEDEARAALEALGYVRRE